MTAELLVDRAGLPRTALSGRVAIVTGAGRGIGRETARALARIGAAVIIAEISERGRDTEQVIRCEGGQALFVQTDVADLASMEHLKQATKDSFGDADIIVNNAVVFNAKPLLDVTLEEWDRTMAVNLRGAFLAMKLFLPDMLKRRQGVFITMESAEGMPYLAPYLATKVGLRSFAQSLASEVGDATGVSAYCFGPGIVETPALLQAIDSLGPLYGMTKDEFIAASGMELVSAELCATGLVGTILHAREYHGQETAYGAGLTKLGLDAGAGAAGVAGNAVLPSHAEVPAESTAGAGDLREAIELNMRMEQMLRDNIREYDELTLFQKPIMRRMFQSGTGMKVEEWLAHAESIRRQLESAAGAGTAPDAQKLGSYVSQLQRLAAFITKQESDARGFIRNPEKLRVALEELRERRRIVDELAEATGALAR